MQLDLNNLEETLFSYMDQIKILFSQELWENILLNCSKNELFVLLLLYRKSEVNMSAIAEYLSVPLNTATGIVSRMEKKHMVERVRSEKDKRVVTIELTDTGHQQIQLIMNEYFKYAQKILSSLSTEELNVLDKLMNKVIHIIRNEDEETETPKQLIRKINIE